MGRKGKWFGAVKKVFSPNSKQKNQKATNRSLESASEDHVPPRSPPQPSISRPVPEIEPSKHDYSVAAAAAPANVAVAEVVNVRARPRFAGKSDEEIAAIKIQTAFRGYLARRALRALRGLVRLKSLIHGSSVKRQATTTLRCMQTLARVQSQVRSRRIRMTEENQALQRQLLLKREKELESLRMGDEWDDSLQSKEQIEASLTSKQEAAIRRERALAYAFTHQGKNSSRSVNPMFMDPNNPHWGWSWLERWMAARPWESRVGTATDTPTVSTNGNEITKSYARRDSTVEKTPKPLRPLSRNSKSASPKPKWTPLAAADDETRSVLSMSSERPNRRHSIAGSTFGDDDSLASSPAVPSYMAPTQSTRARSRLSPAEPMIEGLDKVGSGPAKKKLSFPPSPSAARRHSGPPKVDLSAAKDVAVQ